MSSYWENCNVRMNQISIQKVKWSKSLTQHRNLKIFFCHSFLIFLSFFIVVQLQLLHLFPCCSPLTHHPLHLWLPQSIPTPLSVPMRPLFMFCDLPLPLLSPVISLVPPLWSLSVCSLSLCLWFYFAHLFVWLIRVHLYVR